MNEVRYLKFKMKGKHLQQLRVQAPTLREEGFSDSTAVYLDGLLGMSWYTADPKRPYLVKASASVDKGYQILITDLKNTYFCAGDPETIKTEKKVSSLSHTLILSPLDIQPNHKDR